MKRELVRNLLLYITDQLHDLEGQISTIRLVKILYLIDLEYYNNHGKTLTEIDWVYYHFGPYFFELGDILRSASIDLDAREFVTERGRGFTYHTNEEQEMPKGLEFHVESSINRIIKRWALEDTPILLDFVYHTLPIVYGKRGTSLDFSYETDHLVIKQAKQAGEEFITLDEFNKEFGDSML